MRLWMWAICALTISFTAPAAAQSVTMTGSVKNPGGANVGLAPTVQFVQSCNAGAGGIVGQGDCVAAGPATQSLPYADTATPLGISATYTGSWRDTGATPGTSGSPWAYAEATFTSNQAGTAYIDFSTDGSNVAASVTAALGAGSAITLRKSLTTKYWRVRFVNGALAQASFSVTSATLAN